MNLKSCKWKTVVFALIATVIVINADYQVVAETGAIIQPTPLDSSHADTQINLANCCDGNCPVNCKSGNCKKCYCIKCQGVCCPKVVEKEVKKHCWKVSPKLVCIPGFRWPWEKCKTRKDECCDRCVGGCDECLSKSCKLPCGRVRCVNVLEKHEYTCKKCGYEWTAKCVCTSKCSKKSNACCNCPECGNVGCCDE